MICLYGLCRGITPIGICSAWLSLEEGKDRCDLSKAVLMKKYFPPVICLCAKELSHFSRPCIVLTIYLALSKYPGSAVSFSRSGRINKSSKQPAVNFYLFNGALKFKPFCKTLPNQFRGLLILGLKQINKMVTSLVGCRKQQAFTCQCKNSHSFEK